MPENCGAHEEEVPDEDHVWHGAQDDGSLVYDHDDKTWRLSSESADSKNLQIEIDKSRDWSPALRELSTWWREHVELCHDDASVVDCANDKWPLMFEAGSGDVRRLSYEIRHTPEPDLPFPLCAHVSVLVPAHTDKPTRERMKMRLAGEFRHIYGEVSQPVPPEP